MKALLHLTAIGLISFLGTAQTPQSMIRVGTFHKPSVVVAFYNSPVWNAVLAAKREELRQAQAANDAKTIQELQAWGGTQQELAHRQLSDDAPITNILEALAPAFPGIAGKAQVALIVPDLPYANSMVQTVDVTDLVMDWLQATGKTRDLARQLRGRKAALEPPQ